MTIEKLKRGNEIQSQLPLLYESQRKWSGSNLLGPMNVGGVSEADMQILRAKLLEMTNVNIAELETEFENL